MTTWTDETAIETGWSDDAVVPYGGISFNQTGTTFNQLGVYFNGSAAATWTDETATETAWVDA